MEKFAAQLCNVFGYINAKEEDIILLESKGGVLTPTYSCYPLYLGECFCRWNIYLCQSFW